MKYLMILSVGACLLFASGPAMPDQADDERALRDTLNTLQTTWNAKNLEAHMALYDERMMPWRCSDRAEYESLLKKSFEEQENARAKWSGQHSITFLTPEVAIYKAQMEFAGWAGGDGRTLPPLNVLGAWIMVKKEDKWLLAAYFDTPVEE